MTKRKKPKRVETSPVSNEMAVEIQIRKRYCDTWPNTILELTKRVQGVNNTWQRVIEMVMRIPGLSVSYAKGNLKDGSPALNVTVSIKHPGDGVPVEEVEIHEITVEELVGAQQYIEVLVMDKIGQSKLIARWLEDEAKHIEKRELP